jgi:hypothetical protein
LNRPFIVFAAPAYITDPGGEMRHGDQFTPEPGKVSDMTRLKDTSMTFVTGEHFILKIVHD